MINNIDRRNADFMAECRRQAALIIGSGRECRVAEIVSAALACGAPQYYVEFEYARRHVRDIIVSGRGETKCRGARHKMMHEIAHKVIARMSDKQIKLSDALAKVLAEGNASSFFITEHYARRLYHRCRNEHRRRVRLRGRRLL